MISVVVENVWTQFSFGGNTDLHVLPGGTVTAQRYRDEILDYFVKPYSGVIRPDFILMDYNARAQSQIGRRME